MIEEAAKPAEECWYFVDESGDVVFYDRRGNLIVGQGGCSPILTLGFVETMDPKPIRRALTDLRAQIAADKYLQAIPSIEKTNRAFHAKDDAPEVRYLVYQCLSKLDFRAQFVVDATESILLNGECAYAKFISLWRSGKG